MLKAVAIDDEPIALEIIQKFSRRVTNIELRARFTNAFDVLDFLRKEKIDLLFLDIKMPDISGMELLKRIDTPPMVIFTTAYSEHAVRSFELDAIDYLLKPFSFERFLKACNKAHELHQLKRQVPEGMSDDCIFLKMGYEQVKVNLRDILYVQSAGNYIQVILQKERLLARIKMSEAEKLFPPKYFTRIHRSFIVSDRWVSRLDKNNVHIGDIVIPVASSYISAIKKITQFS